MNTLFPSSGSPRRKPSGCPDSGSPRRKPSGCPLPASGSPRRKPSGCPLPASGSPRRKPSGCPLPVSGCPNSSRPLSAPRAFTLVELLVVIGIIGLLAALLTPVVMRSLASARNAAIKAEIDMLHMAIMNYRSEYGAFPPCADTRTIQGMNPLDSPYTYVSSGLAARHLKRLFPRCSDVAAQLTMASGTTQFGPRTAIYGWLSGYTPDPANPLVPTAQRVKLYDFDTSRVLNNSYHPPGKRESSYIYIDAASYVASNSSPIVIGSASYRAEANPAGGFFNPDTFQILCAGRDEIFFNDDDLSNFWPGTRREYSESLKQ
jgi:prepilin-type N-terminal cleavage/methylation domain-containing protein